MKSGKSELRKSILQKRESLSSVEAAERSARITGHLFEFDRFQGAHQILAYMPVRREVETRGLITTALSLGKVVAVPVVSPGSHDLIPARITDPGQLIPGRWGIPEPPPPYRSIPAACIDMVVVPGVAFDRKGNRLGYGGGFFDRFLPGLAPDAVSIALAYDFQVVPLLEPETHDVPVQFLVTESGLIDCRR